MNEVKAALWYWSLAAATLIIAVSTVMHGVSSEKATKLCKESGGELVKTYSKPVCIKLDSIIKLN